MEKTYYLRKKSPCIYIYTLVSTNIHINMYNISSSRTTSRVFTHHHEHAHDRYDRWIALYFHIPRKKWENGTQNEIK
jgi:hypothetical protein